MLIFSLSFLFLSHQFDTLIVQSLLEKIKIFIIMLRKLDTLCKNKELDYMIYLVDCWLGGHIPVYLSFPHIPSRLRNASFLWSNLCVSGTCGSETPFSCASPDENLIVSSKECFSWCTAKFFSFCYLFIKIKMTQKNQNISGSSHMKISKPNIQFFNMCLILCLIFHLNTQHVISMISLK